MISWGRLSLGIIPSQLRETLYLAAVAEIVAVFLVLPTISKARSVSERAFIRASIFFWGSPARPMKSRRLKSLGSGRGRKRSVSI